MNRILVVAHTEIQVTLFARMNFFRKQDIRYVFDHNDLLGLSNCVVVYLDGWEHHKDWMKIDLFVQMSKIRGVEAIEMRDDESIVEKFHIQHENDLTQELSGVMRNFLSFALERFNQFSSL